MNYTGPGTIYLDGRKQSPKDWDAKKQTMMIERHPNLAQYFGTAKEVIKKDAGKTTP